MESIKKHREERDKRVSDLLMVVENPTFLADLSWVRNLIELCAMQEEELQELRRMSHDNHSGFGL